VRPAGHDLTEDELESPSALAPEEPHGTPFISMSVPGGVHLTSSLDRRFSCERVFILGMKNHFWDDSSFSGQSLDEGYL
jgi:hypothetical protein